MDSDNRVSSFLVSLGGSLLYDEYKGDLRVARTLAESLLEHARTAVGPEALADALLARAQVHVMQGEPVTARELLEEVSAIVPDDANRLFRATTWMYLATVMTTNLFPGSMAAEGIERTRDTWREIELTGPVNKQRTMLQPMVVAPDVLGESVLVFDVSASIAVWRWIVATERRYNRGEALLNQALDIQRRARSELTMHGGSIAELAYIDLLAADLLRLGGRLDEAHRVLRQAEGEYRTADDSAGMAACRMLAGDWQVAPRTTVVSWNMFLDERSPGAGIPDIHGNEFDSPGEVSIRAADTSWSEAERLFIDAGAPRGVAAVQMRRAIAAAIVEDHERALECIEAAMTGFEETEDRLNGLFARVHRALIHIGLGRYPEDQATAREIATWAVTVGSRSLGVGLGQLFSHVGWRWLLRDGHYERALACFRLARTIFQGIGAVVNAAQSLVDLGLAHRLAGETTTALVFMDQARDRYCELLQAESVISEASWIGAANVEMLIYNTRISLKDPHGMQQSADRLLDILARAPVPAGVDQRTWEPETLPVFVWTKTREAVEEMLATARVMVPLELGRAAWDAGDDVEAKRLFADALNVARDAAPQDRLLAEVSVAVVDRRFEDAANFYADLFRVQEKATGFLGGVMRMMGALFGERGKQQLQLQRQRAAEVAAIGYANARAWERAKAALNEIEQLGGADWWMGAERPWEALTLYGRVYEGLGDVEKALVAYQRGIDTLEERRGYLVRDDLKSALAGDLTAQDLYFGASRAALRCGDETASFAFSERGRARAVLDLMAGTTVAAAVTEDGGVREWRQLGAQLTVLRQLIGHERSTPQPRENRIAQLEERVRIAEEELEAVEERLSRDDEAIFVEMRQQASVLTAEEVSNLLAPDTVVIAYAYFFDDLLIWTIGRDVPVQAKLLTVETRLLERDVRELHDACAEGMPTEELAKHLSEVLLQPVSHAVESHERLIIVPAGATWALPFGVLAWNDEPLSATKTISYLPSASSLQFATNHNGRPERVLAIGNPARMSLQPPDAEERRKLRALPWAATEAAYVASIFEGSEALIGAEATEEAVRSRLPAYRYLHFATHGQLSNVAPLLSAILLAEGDSLTVYELMGMRLDADLVVLSACDTGRGVTTRGGEVYGMTRGLLAAGAKSAQVSLWPVDDASTSLLMVAFYRQLKEGNAPAQALRSAQAYVRGLDAEHARIELDRLEQALETRHARNSVTNQAVMTRELDSGQPIGNTPYSHPRHWAPFVLVG